MDSEPIIGITVNGESYELERHNTSLYKHLGHAAIYNHIFHAPDNEIECLYIFEFNDMDYSQTLGYKALELALIDNEYPIHLNMPEPLETDKEAFISMLTKDLDDKPDWLGQ